MKYTKRLPRALTALAITALTLGVAAPAGAAGPGLSHYEVHADIVVTQVLDAGSSPCGTAGRVTFDEHLNAAAAATVAGLTDDEVLAAIQSDTDGVLRQVTVTTTGTVALVAGTHVYSGTFTSWFGGHFMPNGMYVQTGTFSLRATSELGTPLLLVSGGHDVDGTDGVTKAFNQHGHVDGCLP